MYDLTGQDMPANQAMDSPTILPWLFGALPLDQPLHEFVLYQAGYAYDGAIRQGDLVLVVDHNNQATELYDLSNDAGQTNNLINDPQYAQSIPELRTKFLLYNDHDAESLHEPRTTKAFQSKNKTPLPER